jgi:hypothetical protein
MQFFYSFCINYVFLIPSLDFQTTRKVTNVRKSLSGERFSKAKREEQKGSNLSNANEGMGEGGGNKSYMSRNPSAHGTDRQQHEPFSIREAATILFVVGLPVGAVLVRRSRTEGPLALGPWGPRAVRAARARPHSHTGTPTPSTCRHHSPLTTHYPPNLAFLPCFTRSVRSDVPRDPNGCMVVLILESAAL